MDQNAEVAVEKMDRIQRNLSSHITDATPQKVSREENTKTDGKQSERVRDASALCASLAAADDDLRNHVDSRWSEEEGRDGKGLDKGHVRLPCVEEGERKAMWVTISVPTTCSRLRHLLSFESGFRGRAEK